MFYVPVLDLSGQGSFQPPSNAEGVQFEPTLGQPMAMPRWLYRGGYKNYTNEDVQRAIDLIVNDGMTRDQAARETGVPVSTIRRKLKSLVE